MATHSTSRIFVSSSYMGLVLPVFRPVPHSHSLPPRQTTQHTPLTSPSMLRTRQPGWLPSSLTRSAATGKKTCTFGWSESNFCAWGWLVKGWTCDSSSGQGKGWTCAFVHMRSDLSFTRGLIIQTHPLALWAFWLSGSLALWLSGSLALWLALFPCVASCS